MTLLDHVAAGFRIALCVLAMGIVITSRVKVAPTLQSASTVKYRWVHTTAINMIAIGALVASPVRAAWQMRHPIGRDAAMVADLVACSLVGSAFIFILASRGIARGCSPARVKAGLAANIVVLLGSVGTTWMVP